MAVQQTVIDHLDAWARTNAGLVNAQSQPDVTETVWGGCSEDEQLNMFARQPIPPSPRLSSGKSQIYSCTVLMDLSARQTATLDLVND